MLPKPRLFLAALLCSMMNPVPLYASQASLNVLEAALSSSAWTEAEAIARELDARVGRGDIMAAYVASMRHATRGECREAAMLADLVIGALPLFSAPYGIAYRCYAAMGDYKQAIARLETLDALLPDGPERELIRQLLQNEKSRSRPAFGGYVTVAPSSNVNRQTSARTVEGGTLGVGTISDEARGRAGWLLSTGGSVAIRLSGGKDWTLSGLLRTDILYSTANSRFEPSFTAELPFTFRPSTKTQAVLAPYVSIAFADSHHTRNEVGIRGLFSTPLFTRYRLVFQGRVGAIERLRVPERSGGITAGTLALTRPLSTNTQLMAAFGMVYHHTDKADLRTMETTAQIRLDTLLDNGLLMGGEVTIGQRKHWRPAPFVAGKNQSDTFLTLRAEASHRRFSLGPFMPSIYYQFTKSWSDNVFYTYDGHDLGLTLRTKF